MQIQITGHHVDITESLRTFVLEKFEKIERHLDDISNVHVILQVEKIRQTAEATMSVANGELFAKTESNDMYAAIDSLVDKLDRQAIKHKEKMSRHKHPSNKNDNNLGVVFTKDSESESGLDAVSELDPVIVLDKTKDFEVA